MLLHYVTFGDETFAHCLIPLRHYRVGTRKDSALGIRVISAYTEFHQCWCITFKDMNIFLCVISIFDAQILQGFPPIHLTNIVA